MEGIRKLDSFSKLVNCLTNSTFSICVSKLKTENILFDNWQSRKFWVFPQKGVVWKSEIFFKIAWKNHMITWYKLFWELFGVKYWASLDWIYLVGVIKKVGNTARVNFFHFSLDMDLNFLLQRPKTYTSMYISKFEIGTNTYVWVLFFVWFVGKSASLWSKQFKILREEAVLFLSLQIF